jgi:hypothetical protein
VRKSRLSNATAVEKAYFYDPIDAGDMDENDLVRHKAFRVPPNNGGRGPDHPHRASQNVADLDRTVAPLVGSPSSLVIYPSSKKAQQRYRHQQRT